VNCTVNGEPTTLREGTTVHELVRTVVDTERGVAVSLDREVVPRSAWATTRITDGAAVEVLVAAAGG